MNRSSPKRLARAKRYYQKNNEKIRAKRVATYDPEQRKNWKQPPIVRRDAQLRALYGISLADYEAMAAAQQNGCAICGRHADVCAHKKLHVDHNHDTGRVRALLCPQCNTLIGLAKESVELLEKVVQYLRVQHALDERQ